MEKYVVKVKKRLPGMHFSHISIIEVDELIELNDIQGLIDFEVLDKVKKYDNKN